MLSQAQESNDPLRTADTTTLRARPVPCLTPGPSEGGSALLRFDGHRPPLNLFSEATGTIAVLTLTIPSRPRESRTFRHFAKNGFARLILSGNSAPGNYETVPRIDRRDCQGQIGEFLFREMLACFLKDFVGYVTLLDVCDRFGPGAQRSV